MSRCHLLPLTAVLLALTQLSLQGGPPARETTSSGRPRPRTDLHGDPLPEDAAARLGSVRLCHGSYFVDFLAFSPDNRLVASADGSALRLWDIDSGREVGAFATPDLMPPGCRWGFGPEGKTVLAATSNRQLHVWETASGKLLRRHFLGTPQDEGTPELVALFSPDGNTLAATFLESKSAGVELFDVATGKLTARLEEDEGGRPVAYSRDGRLLVTRGPDHEFRVWEAAGGQKVGTVTAGKWCRVAALSPDGKTLALSGTRQRTSLFDVATGEERDFFIGDTDLTTRALEFSPDGKQLILAAPRVVRVLDVETEQVMRSFEGEEWALGHAAFSPDGKQIATDFGNAIRVCDLATGKELTADRGHRAYVYAVCFAPDGRTVATAGADQTIRLWDAATGRETRRWGDPRADLRALAFSADGRFLVAQRTFAGVKVWDARTGREALQFENDVASSFALSPDGALLATSGTDQAIHVWELATGRERSTVPPPARLADQKRADWDQLAFTPDGKRLVAVSRLKPAPDKPDAEALPRGYWWQLGAERPPCSLGTLATLTPHTRALAVTPDGRRAVVADVRGGLQFWDLDTGRKMRELREDVSAEKFQLSPDGKFVAVAALWEPNQGRAGAREGRTAVRLWEVAGGREVRTFAGHRGEVLAVAFAPDGTRLASAGVDGTVLIWDLFKPSAAPPPLGPKERAALWGALAAEDSDTPFAAMRTLLARPEEAVPLLDGHLPPTKLPPRETLARLIADLDADRFETRERATATLARLRGAAEPSLRATLRRDPPAEGKRRLEALLEALPGDVPPSPEHLRALRAVAVLEYLGTSEARRVLDKLARGAAGAPLTEDARAARDRLARLEMRRQGSERP